MQSKFTRVHLKYLNNNNSLNYEQKQVFEVMKFLEPHCNRKHQLQREDIVSDEEDENDERFLDGKKEVDSIIHKIKKTLC